MATFGKRTVAAAPMPARPAFGKRAAGAPLALVKPSAPKAVTAKPAPPPTPKSVAPVPDRPARSSAIVARAAADPVRAAAPPPPAAKPSRAKPEVHTDSGFGKPVWARRIAARVFDELAVWLVIYVVFHDSLMASLSTYASVTPGSGAEAAALVELFGYALVFMIAQSVYNIAMEGSTHQATVGKMLAGVVVTDRYGGPPRLRSVILRNTVGRFAANILPFCSGYVMGLFNKERRCVHDMMANTVVRRRVTHSATASYDGVFA